MAVTPDAGLGDGYELKLNSYDLAVDIELYDAVQRLRFEHPEVKAVVLTGGIDRMFCAGANIQMLAGSSHGHKVNFCKFTNETRNAIEDATAHSGQTWIAAVNGTAAGGGYELALACDEIVLVDDRSSAVSLPEVPLLAVLPGTGGLTRLVDKRHVRRDLADVFATRAEGVQRPASRRLGSRRRRRPAQRVRRARPRPSARPGGRVGPPRRRRTGVVLVPLDPQFAGDELRYDHVGVAIDRSLGAARITVHGPTAPQPSTPDELTEAGADAWVLAAARQLDDAILHLRFNEPEVGYVGPAHRGRRRRGGRRRGGPRRRPLAGPGDPPVLGPHAQAPRPVRAHADRPRRARELLRRDARRRGPRRRPHADPRRHVGGRRAAGDDDAPDRRQRRLVPDVQRPVPPGDPLLGAARRARQRPRAGRQGPARRRGARRRRW